MASPGHGCINAHRGHLKGIKRTVDLWCKNPLAPPQNVARLWRALHITHGQKQIRNIESDARAARCLLDLFAVADQACKGIGWGDNGSSGALFFAQITLMCMIGGNGSGLTLQLPRSLCIKAPHGEAVVLPKSITASVGCTIRSLSHDMALLSPSIVVDASWTLPAAGRSFDAAGSEEDFRAPNDVRLLLIHFPFHIPAASFHLTEPRQPLDGKHVWPAYFGLHPLWLNKASSMLTGERIATEFIIPLIDKAVGEVGVAPHGIVLPECALTQEAAEAMVRRLAGTDIEFVITGIIHHDERAGRTYNRTSTFVLDPQEKGAAPFVQNKDHRWRLDHPQTERYALGFDRDHENDKWWEDIDVSRRTLPFFGLRKEMSFVTLICEDLARSDPAMSGIRAVSPNLVVALLMDGPQLGMRWPGKYATVLDADPDSAVLTLTCAGMVDRAS